MNTLPDWICVDERNKENINAGLKNIAKTLESVHYGLLAPHTPQLILPHAIKCISSIYNFVIFCETPEPNMYIIKPADNIQISDVIRSINKDFGFVMHLNYIETFISNKIASIADDIMNRALMMAYAAILTVLCGYHKYRAFINSPSTFTTIQLDSGASIGFRICVYVLKNNNAQLYVDFVNTVYNNIFISSPACFISQKQCINQLIANINRHSRIIKQIKRAHSMIDESSRLRLNELLRTFNESSLWAKENRAYYITDFCDKDLRVLI